MGKNRGKKRRKNRRGAFAESWRPPALLVWEGFLVSDSLLFNRKSPKIDSFIVFLYGLMCLEWWHGVKIGSFCVCCWDLIGIWCFFGGWTGIPVDCFAFVLFWLLLNGFDTWKLEIVFKKLLFLLLGSNCVSFGGWEMALWENFGIFLAFWSWFLFFTSTLCGIDFLCRLRALDADLLIFYEFVEACWPLIYLPQICVLKPSNWAHESRISV